jgi:hypothetical protein
MEILYIILLIYLVVMFYTYRRNQKDIKDLFNVIFDLDDSCKCDEGLYREDEFIDENGICVNCKKPINNPTNEYKNRNKIIYELPEELKN